MSFKRVIVYGCLIAGSAGAAPADPGDAIGSAVTIVNHVTGEFRQDLRSLATGDDVRAEEVIAAGINSTGELMLRDQTKVAVGPEHGSRSIALFMIPTGRAAPLSSISSRAASALSPESRPSLFM
jgi:hypothetical protein